MLALAEVVFAKAGAQENIKNAAAKRVKANLFMALGFWVWLLFVDRANMRA